MAAGLRDRPAFDAVFTWDWGLTEAFAGEVDPNAIRWLEDLLPYPDLAAYRRFKGLGLPLATGERLGISDDASIPLAFELQAFTLDVVGCGGLTRAIGLVAEARTAAARRARQARDAS